MTNAHKCLYLSLNATIPSPSFCDSHVYVNVDIGIVDSI